jgi:quinol monooxygenase YgiN
MNLSPAPNRLAVAGTFRAHKGLSFAVKRAIEAVASASREEDGCVAYSFASDVFEPTLIRVFEIWRDAAAYKVHRQSTHVKQWRAKWPDLGLGDAELTIYEIALPTPA